MRFEELAVDLDGSRSGDERVVGHNPVLDHDEWIFVSGKSWEARSHVLLKIHC